MRSPFPLVFLLAASLFGQGGSAGLTGVITDPSQARLPNVNLRLTNDDTGVVTTAITNSQGEFAFTALPPGRYRLAAEASGFQSATRTGLVLELGRVTRLDLVLALGQVAESVEVVGAAPMLESETSTVGQFIENKTIVDMPLNGRRVGDLLGIMGNAVLITTNVIRPRVVIGGGRADQQQWQLDGVNASNIALEVSQALFNPPVESVQEIRVQQNGYSAEYGNSSSGVVTINTRSGTNQLRGTLYHNFRNDRLDARNFFAADRPPLRWNVFGFSVGGPVIKNRTFFFTNTEWQRQRIGVVRLFTVPTERQRAGDFSETLTAGGQLVRIFDPATTRPNPANPTQTLRDQFPGNIIPANRLDPVAMRLLDQYPLPNRPAANLAGANNFVANATNALNITTWTSKVDHVFREADRVSVRFILHDFPTYTTNVFPNAAADPNAIVQERRAYSLMANHIHMFSANVLNDFRFNWQPRYFRSLSLGLGEGWPTQLGLQGVSDRAFPRVNVAGFTPMGAGNHERLQFPIRDTHFVNALSWFRGSHSFKFGGELRLGRNAEQFNQLISGQLNFQPQATALPGVANTGTAMASLILGVPHAGIVRYADPLDRRSQYWAFFVQDDWKATRNLTVNLGLRWDAHTPRVDANDRQNSFDRDAINPVSGTPGVVTFAGMNGLGRTVYRGDWNNFAPRVGIAWKPFDSERTVIRAGFGLFYGPPLPGSNNTSAGFETSGEFTTPDNGLTAPFLLRNGFPDTSRTSLDASFGAVPVGQPIRFAPEFIDQERQLGYTQQWNFGIQRELGWNTLVELSYLGTIGRRLNGPNTNINQVHPDQMGPGNAQVRRPYPQFGNVTVITPMWGNSEYHGGNLKFEKRFSHGLNFLANYTWSKFMDDVPAGFEVGLNAAGIQNVYNRRAEWALSGNDVPHRVAFSSVYELPVGRNRKWLTQGPAALLLGGWNIGTIITLQQGSPMGLVTQQNTTNAFTPGPQRVNVLRDPTLPTEERTITRYFDTTAVAAPPQFTFGNAGRAILRGPGYANVDLSLLKNFLVTERLNIQLRGEAFNAFNRANFEEPGNQLGAPNFGVISAAQAARSIQLGLRVTF